MFLTHVIDITVKKLKSQAANLITLSNLFLGSFAILYVTKGQLHLSLLLIFLAALMDRFDGITARKLQTESEFGKQLDSMCDIISFGIAPAMLLYQGVLNEFGSAGMFVTIFYISCGAIRLARFNISEQQGYFTGVPITVVGCIATLLFLLTSFIPGNAYLFIMVVLSLCMVSPFKVKKM
ncbi:CDP-diacylglycerol--serine O-phosphatidyltransferase [Bacillus carboniphilus]|uniref:CDP-diacylglycerol--serine O-phosphatidyltransferase n=1 Tax=Bacillus carboniphilus TaxID=86663 RepID=A0ABN0WKZ9_9BACI